jgi:malonyl-CoA O-methyltransferase
MNKPVSTNTSSLKRQVRASFNAAAERYDATAVLQKEVGKRIIERLDLIRLAPKRILDVGAGTGECSRALMTRYKKAQVISLDLAECMLQRARGKSGWLQSLFPRQHYVCADTETIPLADNSVDFVFSNLTLQWCSDLDTTFQEFRRILRPNGLLMFSTFGPDTLKELRASWRAAEGNNNTVNHVNPFMDMHDIGDALLRAALADPVMDVENITLTYEDARQLMHELKAIGAHTVSSGRRQGLTGKARLRAMLEAYEDFRKDGRLPATYEVVYGHAWCGEEKGEIHVPLTNLSNRL